VTLRPYPRYKPSGIDWLGDVPEHWTTTRLKYIASINDEALPETTSPEAELAYVDIGSIDPARGIVDVERFAFDDAPSRARRIVRDGDSIISTVRTYLHAIAPIVDPPSNLIVSTGFAVVRPRSVDSKFLSYAVREKRFVETIVARSVGVSYPAANADDIASIELPLPNALEQELIATYLDDQVSRVDRLIAKKRALIERLREKRGALISETVTRGLPPEVARAAGLNPHPKLKPSGIDWIGEIPKHWTTPPLYARYRVDLGKMLDENRITGEYLLSYLRNIDVQWDGINVADLPEMDILPVEFPRYTIKEGDLLICEGGEVGRAAIVPAQATGLGFQKALHRVRPGHNTEVPRFLYYTLLWVSGSGVFMADGNPNTISHLTAEKLRRYRFPCPPMAEQSRIAEFLDVETEKLDNMIGKIREAIDRLREYRMALITAAVTGKVDLREAISASRSELLVAAG
jgi:type I restriction enzyme, S subunit